jgi:hypothetical protein
MLNKSPKDVSLLGLAVFEKDKAGDVFTVWYVNF